MADVEKVEWKDEYLIGIDDIDSQHKKLVEIINDLYYLIKFNAGNYVGQVGAILDELVKYSDYHFKHEETNYLRKYGYANTEIHVMQHNNFIGEMKKKIDGLDTTTTDEGKKLYTYLITWLLNHIARADKAWSKLVLPNLPK